MKIACVILNYNDVGTVEQLVDKIRDYTCFSHIVLVDNASTDDSCEHLRKLEDEKVKLICAGRNGGYGAGNNLGVYYAAQQLGATHVLIVNPDVTFSEACIRRLGNIFLKHPEVGAAAALMEDKHFQGFPNAWRLHGFVGELLLMGPVSRRLFRDFLYYPNSYLEGKKAVRVDVIQGSMLMVSAEAFIACGGYDEGIFLYQEEMVLAKRLKDAGFGTVLLLADTYQHEHSQSISRSFQGDLERQKLREKSVLYYMDNYLHIGRFQKMLARLWFAGIRAETWGYTAISKYRKK